MLISKTVETKWNSKTKKYYESKGYVYTKMSDTFEVKVEDLRNHSRELVEVKCDNSNCENLESKIITYKGYIKCVHEDGKYYCQKCATKLFAVKSQIKNKIKNGGKSFYDWCIEHNKQDVLDRWDCELNECSPKDVSFSTHKKYYFKCPKRLHNSELKDMHSFTIGEGSMACKACNSFTQWGIDNVDSQFLDKYWDYDKNNELGINPWEINYGSNNKPKIWIKCQKDFLHESYPIFPNSFTCDIRCPICNKSKGEERIEKYLINNNLNKDYTSQKEFDGLIGINNGNLSYDFYLLQYNLLIEYQGIQHEKYITGFHRSKKDFEKQQEHDRRKKEYAQNHNIKLLEIWYWNFDNIEEILDKELNINKKDLKEVI